MNQELKQSILAGPYKVDPITQGVYAIRGQGHAVVAKCATGIYNRKGVTVISVNQAEAHAQLVLEAFMVFALSGKSPMEMHKELTGK